MGRRLYRSAAAAAAAVAIVPTTTGVVKADQLHNPPTWSAITATSGIGLRWTGGIYNSTAAANVGSPYGPLCTAFFYDNNTVASAAHCLWGPYNGYSQPNVLLTSVGTTSVSRGAYFNGSSAVKPYGVCNATGISVGAYAAAPYPRQKDYGAMRLTTGGNCQLPGDWFPLSSAARMLPSVANTSWVAGYPAPAGTWASKPFTLLRAPGSTWEPGFSDAVTADILCHTSDTISGMSGGALYQNNTSGVLVAIGIHAWGTNQFQLGCDGNTNTAIRMSPAIQSDLLNWRA